MAIPRVSRQILLPEIGEAGQARIAQSSVLCIGTGGLGSPAALYLAAAGVGTLGIIDPDRVEESNLHRQVLFGNPDLGLLKASAAAQRLKAAHPEIGIHAFDESFTADNSDQLVRQFDLIIDGSDNFETRYIANEAAHRHRRPLVYAAVDRFEGQTAIFWSQKTACYRCLYPEPPQARIHNCAEAGVLGSIAGVIGTLQATLALQYLVSEGDPKHPLCPGFAELTQWEFRGSWRQASFSIPKRKGCRTCSVQPPPQSRKDPQPFSNPRSIEPHELASLRQEEHGSPLRLLDVRTLAEWNEGSIPGALHWPLDRIRSGDLPPDLKPSQTIVVYCLSGGRSSVAAALLKTAGFQQVLNLSGGISRWKSASKGSAP